MIESGRQTTMATAYQEQMLADLRVLAEEIGIRFPGTAGDERAANYIARRLAETGLKPHQTPFRIMGWTLHAPARLQVAAPGTGSWDIPTFPYVYSSSTPPGGFSGRLVTWGRQELLKLGKFRPFERPKFLFRKYALLDDADSTVGYVVSRDFPQGAPVATWGVLPLPLTTPTVMIGEEDGRRLEGLVESDQPIQAQLQVSAEFNPAAVTRNITARLQGSDSRKSQEQIVVAAHYDTQYTSPGAVDNGSGVAALLSLAAYFRQHPLKHSLLFAVYGAEEIGLVGSTHHFRDLKASQELSTVRAVVNLDMLACNEPSWIHASEDFLAQDSVRRAAKDVGIEDKYGWLEIVTPPWPSGDQDIFYDHGIPSVSFTWKGYKYPFTHTAEDTMDKVDTRVLADSFDLACRVIEHMDRML